MAKTFNPYFLCGEGYFALAGDHGTWIVASHDIKESADAFRAAEAGDFSLAQKILIRFFRESIRKG